MSINLTIYGNHKLGFDTYASAIQKIEKALNFEIIDWEKGDVVPKTSEILDDYKLWTNHQFYRNFDKYGIVLNSTHRRCDRISVYKNSFTLSIIAGNMRYQLWQELISNRYQMNDNYIEDNELWMKQIISWNEFKSFADDILLKFGGDTFIYLNDTYFGDIDEELTNGAELEAAISKLNLKYEGFNIDKLKENRVPTALNIQNWFIERVPRAQML